MKLLRESISDLPIYIEEDILEEMDRRGTDRLSLEDAINLIGLNPYFKTATNHTIRYLILSWSPLSAASCRGKVLLLEVSMASSKLLFSSTVENVDCLCPLLLPKRLLDEKDSI